MEKGKKPGVSREDIQYRGIPIRSSRQGESNAALRGKTETEMMMDTDR